ncbi:MAG TPA: hypothetical protein VFD49_09275 [Candidatus Dormibacteraeota bacterium]|nr:hypothetical protein [Candidatus Dormibacteraeota bacterium]
MGEWRSQRDPWGRHPGAEGWWSREPAHPGWVTATRPRPAGPAAVARRLTRVDARPLAFVLGALATLGLLGATLSFAVDVLVAPWRLLTADVEESLHLLASLIGIAGAFALWRGTPHARAVVLAGLALNVGATLAFSADTLLHPSTWIPLSTWAGLAVLTLRARPAPPRPRPVRWVGAPPPTPRAPVRRR